MRRGRRLGRFGAAAALGLLALLVSAGASPLGPARRGNCVGQAAVQRERAEPISLGVGPHLFLDDYLIESSENVTRRVNPPRRDPANPVVTGPGDKNFQPYVTVLRDPKTKRFRVWYGVPESATQSHLATMESEDGARWVRPHRVLEDPDTIQFGTSVLDEGPDFSDPAKRFKFGWWHGGGLKVAASPDGLAWKPLAPGVLLPHNHDINSIHRDPLRGRYVAFLSSVGTGPAWKGQRRHTLQSVSDDCVHWEKPWPVLTPDDSRDQGETQFYCLSGLLVRGGLLIGMLKVLRDDLPADPDGPVAGIGYTVLAWSRDGRTWTRDREPFFDRDPRQGAWDHAMAWADCQLPVGEEVFVYYGGYARGHKVERFTERQIGLARMRRDRYAAREAGETSGTLRTPVVTLSGGSLTLNTDAAGGEVRAEVQDADGRPLPGFTMAECRPVTGDSLAAPLRWKTPLSRLKGKAVRLVFSLRRARLFAFDLGR